MSLPHIDDSLVGLLIATQFHQWADLPLRRVEPAGSDNVIYRLGEDMAVRLPRGPWASGQPILENRRLGALAGALPLPVPEQLGLGEPAFDYPWHWSINRWLEGEAATPEGLTDPLATARELADFLRRLRETPAPGALEGVSGVLASRDAATREAIAAVSGVYDTGALTRVWDEALAAPEWSGPPVWFHGDMHNGNLLIVDGRLTAVLDFGGLGVGDPACDLVVAWTLFEPDARAEFRRLIGLDDDAWTRGRGWAISTGLSAYTAYADTRPDIAEATTRQITEALR
ncbi:hypothetical protein Afil01_63590 [Actinorhabdospora filicis]|uniref:Aminoglycoside phosphotransferase domain-containing protein n=1 Tax=Actinorhabdospora filicis TaxID=1785913 RepID=A0A9W6SSL6_9ACTN|nr:aminoglycoside phosphotransferase family protein [Actinorhabdospora filicis]GLZ81552.1 hypothetical protein Afil01_63590 [Actinorhabdospora filicis]